MGSGQHQPTTSMTPILNHVPFTMWGIDLVRKLRKAKGSLEYVVEMMNRILFRGIKKNMIQSKSKKGAWIEELPVHLWSLKTTPSHATGKTPFNLVYGSEAVLPAEARLPTYHQLGFSEEENDQRMREELNFVDELRDKSLYKMHKYKHLMARAYNRVIGPGTYELEKLNGDMVPRTWHASNLEKYYV
ncbi:hypothetical protein LIER_30467 [Lithospermum erythrorhizon]|uniref:Uncharacterized protein n=1 Tax=Lithospermum erythrorhizon TaxID=34254 RepID=A0AAV3RRR1_LITER